MSEQEHRPPDKSKRPRVAQGAKHASRKQIHQATPASLPGQEAAAPLAAKETTGITASQALPAAKALPQPEPDELPIGVLWGKFPTRERQAELKEWLERWERESNHGNYLSPFAGEKLDGADVYWLAAFEAGSRRNIGFGKEVIDKHFPFGFSNFNLQQAYMFEANLEGAFLDNVHLQEVTLHRARLAGASLNGADLARANLQEVQLRGASLLETQLQGANLIRANLEGADLRRANLEGANLSAAYLTSQTKLQGAILDVKTQLAEIHIDATLQVADVVWNGAPLIRIDWRQLPYLGDEAEAHQAQTGEGNRKEAHQRLEDFESAARAYRQLAIALRGQGIAEAADRFSYRALIMQRKSLWWQIRSRTHFAQPKGASSPQHGPVQEIWRWLKGIFKLIPLMGSYLFSLFLAILTGYGFRMSRIILAYALLILVFGGAYWGLDRHAQHPLNFGQALIVSITAFHGRVFSYNPFTLSDPQIVVTAIEAICGLVIEGLFVAMLVQRFFNR